MKTTIIMRKLLQDNYALFRLFLFLLPICLAPGARAGIAFTVDCMSPAATTFFSRR